MPFWRLYTTVPPSVPLYRSASTTLPLTSLLPFLGLSDVRAVGRGAAVFPATAAVLPTAAVAIGRLRGPLCEVGERQTGVAGSERNRIVPDRQRNAARSRERGGTHGGKHRVGKGGGHVEKHGRTVKEKVDLENDSENKMRTARANINCGYLLESYGCILWTSYSASSSCKAHNRGCIVPEKAMDS
ncbi:hypothetical protein BV25DRAFT_1828983, partial [Artomyces pyxidatus]